MKKLCILCVMALLSLNGMAQKQTLDMYKTVPLPPMEGITLVTVKKATFNIYEKPNGKRRAEGWGAPGEFIKNYGPSLFGAKMHPTGWAYIFSGSESGFANPKDFQKGQISLLSRIGCSILLRLPSMTDISSIHGALESTRQQVWY